MRDIKFRIWADNRFYDKCLVGNTNNVNDEKWTCPMVWLEDKKEWVHCDRGITSQFTGLKDKNGKEIYEGDIVKIFTSGKWRIGTVIYEHSGFTIDVTTNKELEYGRTSIIEKLTEVVGNIYENKDLLEESEEK